ncbi:probable vesicular glutamate transporter eat-4 [Acyrthosiphon pisum]|uniref:Uncharacterized protein n=1 Tax=Acyrthosiphon pisum TaxID=7029 RepID=A0A8R2D5M4_ACYPI|nr:probable vesicular glutamate transporter eat-4 [Acyrthosiphon pisum]XP_008186281.1 probable vesicular glutamate transporter eat-4 [Acyrthosiphon pisum]XP_016662570.1 probable vesicular glutamate transporter eat-4 [Acyrthosiphon pisum]XP_016662571.1 probable vesicular glutamate transporter eat-4 [Acyrthosiphon pisum]XP_016662573.1 probable vesicular glutamate transporter eat-4 [Acyrthosiphon pisum]|eukprot:XP_008186280.1 PREDICTED: probable vesicular glutamate transporter eat-4 [Acyrthosiphon pisum]
MEFEDIATSRLDCPSQIQPPDQTTSRFIDRIIRLKTRYWNRGFLIVLLTFIGLTIQWLQNQSLKINLSKSYEEINNVQYIFYGMCVGYFPGGVLTTIFSAQKVYGISFIISSILHIMEALNYLKAYLYIFSLFCIGMTLAIASTAYHRIYTFWVPLNKKSVRHVPIILWMMVVNYKIKINVDLNLIRELQGIVVLPWFVLWLIVVGGDRSQSPNRGFVLFRLFGGSNTTPLSTGTNVVSLRRPTISDIPWKSICTSMPVIALVLSYICYANLHLLHRSYNSYQYPFKHDQSLSKHTTILLFITFILIELIPEITMCFSVTNVRKIFSCLYFVSMGIIYYVEAFPDNIFLFLDNKKFVHLIYNFMPYFSLFGFKINHLDIAPQYSSVLFGIFMTIYYITWFFSPSILKYSLIFEKLNQIQFCFLVAVINLAVAVFYVIFASAELQPWAVDKPVKESQRNMQEEVNLTAL